jgi:hypothetical protein
MSGSEQDRDTIIACACAVRSIRQKAGTPQELLDALDALDAAVHAYMRKRCEPAPEHIELKWHWLRRADKRIIAEWTDQGRWLIPGRGQAPTPTEAHEAGYKYDGVLGYVSDTRTWSIKHARTSD